MAVARLVSLSALIIVCGMTFAQDSVGSERDALRAEQEDIACQLADNYSILQDFKSSIRERHGVDPDYRKSQIIIPCLFLRIYVHRQ